MKRMVLTGVVCLLALYAHAQNEEVNDSLCLGEVVLKGARPIMKMKGDAMVVAVEGSYLSKLSTA